MTRISYQIASVLLLIFTISRIALSQTELTAEQIYDEVSKSVVMIITNDNNGGEEQGSGVVISDAGYVVTCFHLIENSSSLKVVHQNKEFKDAKVIAEDMQKDIAIIKISGTNLVPVKIGSSEGLKPGQKIYTISSPVGYENTITEGIISGLRKDNSAAVIQSTAPITEGSSGGALLNSRGELIGILSSGQHEGSIYFSIPVNDVIKLYAANTEKNNDKNLLKEGILATDEGNYSEAVTLFSKQLDKNYGDAEAYFNRGKAYARLNDFENAVKDFTSAIDLNPEFVDAFNSRGLAYRQMDEFKKAIEDYSSALIINPNYSEALFNRGISYFYLDNYELAVNDYASVIELNPEVPNVYYNRGFAYKKSGKIKEALSDFETAIKLNAEYRKILEPVIESIKKDMK